MLTPLFLSFLLGFLVSLPFLTRNILPAVKSYFYKHLFLNKRNYLTVPQVVSLPRTDAMNSLATQGVFFLSFSVCVFYFLAF